MQIITPAAFASLLLVACTAATSPGESASAQRNEPSRYLTILEAPPPPYPAVPPAEPAQGEDLIATYARENGISRAAAANGINGRPEDRREATALAQKLRAREKGNFTGLRLVRDPAATWVFTFKRDAVATLARYSRNPRFRAEQGGRTMAELESIRERWMPLFTAQRLMGGAGINPDEGRIDVDMNIAEAEFRAIAERNRWALPPELRLRFPPPQPQPAIIGDAGQGVRSFARSDRWAGIVPSIATFGRIVLQDGCFRQGKDGPLVLFHHDAQLRRDGEGYLAVSNQTGAVARIGEQAQIGYVTPAQPGEREMAALREQCGPGPVVTISGAQSERLWRIRPWTISSYARERRLGRAAAWREMLACWQAQDGGRERFRQCDVPGGRTNPPPPRPAK